MSLCSILSSSSSCKSFEDYMGQSALISYLKRVFRSGTPSHAYMFYGPNGAGKRALANICARSLFCVGEQKPCNECAPCRRYLTANHPDVTVLQPRPLSIGVAEIRALLASLSVRSYEGGYKAVIIESADTMTTAAANALLKTLESPPGNTVFFLLTEKTLMPTIISRCQPIRFGRVSERDVANALLFYGVSQERASALAKQSDGLVGRALSLHDEPPNIRETVEWALLNLTVSGIPEASKKLSELDHNRVLDLMEERLSELARRKEAVAIESYAALIDARRKVSSHVSFQSVIENVLFALTGG